MKFTKKCDSTQHKISKSNRRRSSAGMFYTSSAGAVTSLICFGNQKMLSRTRVAPARRHGRSALILGRNLRNVLYSIFLITLPVLFVHQAHATASTLTISVTDSVALNISSLSDTGNFAHSDTSTNNVSIITNNGTGYTLGIKAKTNNSNALINSDDTSKTIPSITTSISESTYASSSSYNNTWGLRPSKLNSAVNENYIQAPTSASTLTTLDKTTSANPSTANNYNLAIGARINSSTTPGSYSNVFVITVTANPIPYTITYNKNTTDTVTNMPANTSSQTYDETVNISDQVPARDGFNFKGWCTTQVADGGTCTGTTYNPDGGRTDLTWTLNQTASSNSLTIYAMWESADPCIGHQNELYCKVAAMSKGKNTDANSHFSWTSITTPTSTNPSTDTSSSGVFEWDGMTTGNGVDSNGGNQKIYFYRGILDTTVATYGSDGLADAYPNYVKLSNNTCWRIVRTTSTGGVKMIYNGTWGDTTANSCANTQQKAQTRYNNADLTVSFNTSSSSIAGKKYTGLQYLNIHAIGYTYTSSVAASTTSTKTPAQLFGASPNGYSTNDKSSIMKQYVEDWYAGTMTSYTSKLEGDAGFCQDRRLNTGTTWTSPLDENSNTIVPYGTSGMTPYYFGAYPRNAQSSTFNLLLTCPRGKVDLYSYTSNAGNGNGQLTYPVALLTADETSLAGSGWNNSFSAYNANSFLRSGSNFWLLSPNYRTSGGIAYGFDLRSNGYLYNLIVSNSYGVRPAISLKSGTTPVSGTGTATDPWIVNP